MWVKTRCKIGSIRLFCNFIIKIYVIFLAFVPLLGQIDNFIGYVIMRIIPADPRCQRASSLSVANRVFIFNPNLIVASPNVRKKHFQSAEGISPNGGDDLTSRNDETGGEGDRRSLSTTADYPFIFGFSLFFLVNRTIVPLFNGFDLEAVGFLATIFDFIMRKHFC